MSNEIMNRKERHNTPLRYGFNNEFSDLINNFFGNMLDLPLETPAALRQSMPKVEVEENENDVVVSAEMPGIPENNIDLEVSSDGYLTISGEKKQEKKENRKGSYFSEFSYGSFKRTIPLPWDLKFDDAKADYKDGVLKVLFPKSQNEQGKKKKISISRK